jgi:hypothetical protein
VGVPRVEALELRLDAGGVHRLEERDDLPIGVREHQVEHELLSPRGVL